MKNVVQLEKQTRIRLPQETKDYIVKMILEEGVKVRKMSRKFEIGESTMQRWLNAGRDKKKQESTRSKFITTTKEHDKCRSCMKKSYVP